MEVINEKMWNDCLENNKGDAYGERINKLAKDWANLMEARIANGERLEDIADDTFREANYDGVTGFMYGCAVSVLTSVWKHGDELRRWHNLDCQIGDEGEKANESGGVLNPAIINISVPYWILFACSWCPCFG